MLKLMAHRQPKNWWGIRCWLRSCPFKVDNFGARCTTVGCHRRITWTIDEQEQMRNLVVKYKLNKEKDFDAS